MLWWEKGVKKEGGQRRGERVTERVVEIRKG